MPLKPVLERAPLYPDTWTPLRPGQIRSEWKLAEDVYRLACKESSAAVAEGAVRLAYALSGEPEQEAPVLRARDILSRQAEDGSLSGDAVEQLQWVRAIFALAEASGEREALNAVLRWVGWCAGNLSLYITGESLKPAVADLFELLEKLYLLTGKEALLALMDRLRGAANEWCMNLHTFSQQRPSVKIAPEGRDLRSSPVALADGFRASTLAGHLTGSGKQLTAATVCWQKLSRYHASVAGGTSAAPDLEGASPAQGQSATSIGAWTEALTLEAMRHDNLWAWREIDRLIANALPAAVSLDGMLGTHRVNRVHLDHKEPGTTERFESLARIARAAAAIVASAVCMEGDGIRIQHLLPGTYRIAGQDGVCALRIQATDATRCLVSLRGSLNGTLRIRIPAYCNEFSARLAGGGQYLGDSKHHLTLRKTWRSGDELTVSWQPQLHMEDAHHQGKAIYLGATLMAMPADEESYAVALIDTPMLREDKVWVKVAPVKDWPMKGDQPADIPVLPTTEGEEEEVCLSPFSSLKGRVALFPSAGRNNA